MNIPSNSQLSSLPANISTYLLQDYTFLQQYSLIESPINSQTQFLARINSTLQMVKFIKKPLLPINTLKGLNMYKRFQVMFEMFQKGLILADNMFVLEEGNDKYFYYVIQPYLCFQGTQIQMPFMTLQQYLLDNRNNMLGFQPRKAIFIKCKNLLDNLLQSGQPYCGLNTRNIVIDDEGNTFLMPFNLQFNILNKPYERSFYPVQILKHLVPQTDKQPLKFLQKWDIWSFGCIAAEIFLYVTPYFMSTSVERQIYRIQTQAQQIFQSFKAEFIRSNQNIIEANTESECSINQNILIVKEEATKILNFLINAFNSDENSRLISFESNEKASDVCQRLVGSKIIKKFYKKIQKNKGQKILKISRQFNQKEHQKNHQDNFKQLNTCQMNNQLQKAEENEEELYDFRLKFKSFIFSKGQVKIKGETEVLIEFCNEEKFKFFIDLPEDQQDMDWIQIELNKKITFPKRSFSFADSLLQDKIIVTISFHDAQQSINKTQHIVINLSTLLIKNDQGERMWNKPIKGSYATQSDSLISCKIKIQADLQNRKTLKNQETRQKMKPSIQQDQEVASKILQIEDPQQTSRFPSQDDEIQESNVLKLSQKLYQNELNINQKNPSLKPQLQEQPSSNSPATHKLQNRVKKLIKQSRPNPSLLKKSDLANKLKKLLIG